MQATQVIAHGRNDNPLWLRQGAHSLSVRSMPGLRDGRHANRNIAGAVRGGERTAMVAEISANSPQCHRTICSAYRRTRLPKPACPGPTRMRLSLCTLGQVVTERCIYHLGNQLKRSPRRAPPLLYLDRLVSPILRGMLDSATKFAVNSREKHHFQALGKRHTTALLGWSSEDSIVQGANQAGNCDKELLLEGSNTTNSL